MKVFENSIIASSILLMVTIGVHGNNLADLDPPERITLSGMANVKLGIGVELNYLPIIEYTRTYNPLRIDCIIQTRMRKKCNLSLDIGGNAVNAEINKVVQLDEKKVIVLWNEITSGTRFYEFAERITTLDMDTCTSAISLKFPLDKNSRNGLIHIVPYKAGFKVISLLNLTNSLTSYDAEGRKIGESKSFFSNDIPRSIVSLSLESNSKGFFIISRDDLKFKLILVDANGNIVKQLLESEAIDIVSHLNQSVYSTCWNDITQNETMIVYCVQFDASGNENYREQSLIPNHDWLLAVQRSKDNSLVLFALSDDLEMLHVNVIKPNCKVQTLSYNVRSVVGNRRILDFNDVDGTFVFAYESDLEHKIVLQKYYLPIRNDS